MARATTFTASAEATSWKEATIRTPLYGGTGDDLLFGGADDDNLDGDEGFDKLYGEGGNDVLRSGNNDGPDELHGGDGDDHLFLDRESSATAVVLNITLAGNQSTGDGTIVSGIERLTFEGGLGNDLITSGGLEDNLKGGEGDDILHGGEGKDDLDGGAGTNQLFGDGGDDKLNSNSAGIVHDHLDGGTGNDLANIKRTEMTVALTINVSDPTVLQTLVDGTTMINVERLDVRSGSGADHLTGGNFREYFKSGAGNDQLFGGGGIDQLQGGADDDWLDGGEGADTLIGDSGNDTMVGGTGDDVYSVDSVSDIVSEAAGVGSGNDTVFTLVNTTLSVNVKSLIMVSNGNQNGTGSADNNWIYGNAFNNIIDGGLGNDLMVGGAGDDIYVVDIGYDATGELAGGGIDQVYSSTPYAISANVEVLFLTGTANLGIGNDGSNWVYGNAAANTLQGLGGNDTLWSYDGNDVLDGGANADEMHGGAGNDTYFVDSASDLVFEAVNEGSDSVYATTSYGLSANVDNLIAGTLSAVGLSGNNLSNYLIGNAGNDTLDGYGAADWMQGGAGLDTFVLRKGGTNGDVIADFNGNGLAAGDQLLLIGFGANAIHHEPRKRQLVDSKQSWKRVFLNVQRGELGRE